jgi:acetoin utilization protein AcuB
MLAMRTTVGDHMHRSPQTIGRDETLTRAHELMRHASVRHLPVVDAGRLAGMLSLRDLHLIETLRDVLPDEVRVEEAMSAEVYVVAPDTPLDEAARVMADHKYGSAVVVEDGRVAGVFTTIDALGALAEIVAEQRAVQPRH